MPRQKKPLKQGKLGLTVKKQKPSPVTKKLAKVKQKSRPTTPLTTQLSLQEWNDILGERAVIQSLRKTTIHTGSLSNIVLYLQQFDDNSVFGPCIGFTRLERWKRANEMGLEPSEDIRGILESDWVKGEIVKCHWDQRGGE